MKSREMARVMAIAAAAAVAAAWGARWSRGAGRAWERLTRAQWELRAREFVSGMPVAREDMRLALGVLEYDKVVQAESVKRLWGLDLGATRVSVTVPVRAHYAVDLSAPRAVELRPEGRRLVAEFPALEVLAVEVLASRKSAVREIGWGRLASRSGRALEDAVDRGLHEAARAESSSPRALGRMKEIARPALARFVKDYLSRRAEDGARFEDVEVRFRDDGPPRLLAWSRGGH